MIKISLEEKVFDYLFHIAEDSDDTKGVVCSCIADEDGKIVASSPSSNDGRHAEYIVLEKMKNGSINITAKLTLFTTLEPCSKRSNPDFKDCTTLITESGIKNVVFAAIDPEFGKDSEKIIKAASIKYHQVNDKKIIQKSRDLFNSTNTDSYRI